MKKEETDTLTLRIPISIKLRLEMLANQDSRTINSLVNKILKDYIDNVKKQGQLFTVPLNILLFYLSIYNFACITYRINHGTNRIHIDFTI